MDEFGIETREGNPPEQGGSELMPAQQVRSDEPAAKTSSTQDVEAARPGAPPAPARQARRRLVLCCTGSIVAAGLIAFLVTVARHRSAAGAAPNALGMAPATPTSRAGSAEVLSRYFAEAVCGACAGEKNRSTGSLYRLSLLSMREIVR